jgi:hypothetical protein
MSMQLRGEGIRGGIGGFEEEANLSGGALGTEALSEVHGGTGAAGDGG